MRRNVIALVGVLLLLVVGMIPAAARQEATSESGLADLGLPELDVTVTASGYEGIPETLEAGRYLVTVTAGEDTGEFGGGVALVQPTGMSADEYLALMMSGPSSESGGSVASTPMAGMDATPAEGDLGADAAGGMEGPPAALFEAMFAGGAYAGPGQTEEVVLDLPPGEWIAWADDPEAAQEPVVFEVTGEMPADLAEPESSATITMGEYVIGVTEGELTAGQHILKIENRGLQPHFIAWFTLPPGTTEEQVEAVLEEEAQAEMTGTPPVYTDLNPDEDIVPVTFSGTQSIGTSIWIPVDVPAGTNGLACFFPDIADGMPHAYKGMYAILEITE